ncbi:transglycosylase SLT domain-containing protein, partial [Candidatus Micrarchaeota archaeon]|nr:transglycosylase SLT domain-containing protein [Candidatus Micrarchaeota archaeon]
MRNAWIAIFILIFAFGCTDFENVTKKMGKELEAKDISISSEQDLVDYGEGKCMAMVCVYNDPFLAFWREASLFEGKCKFTDIDFTSYSTYVENYLKGEGDREVMPMFMFGAGHSLFSFDSANSYCKSAMGMAVKWLVGNEYSEYTLPSKSRTDCLLKNNVMPVYILYSGMENVSKERAGEIAKIVDGSGPTILVSEIELDDSDSSKYQSIREEIFEMKKGCSDCLIALGVKLNGSSEFNVTDEIFSDEATKNNVDLIAYGIDSHNFDTCKAEEILFYASNFSNYALNKYEKFSVIPYVLFDRAESADGSCNWTNQSVGYAYSDLFVNMHALVGNGIIGTSIYSLYGGGPLECTDCGFVNARYDDCNPTSFSLTKNEPAFTNFMGFCRSYYSGVEGEMSGIQPIVASKGATNCNYAVNTNIYRYMDERGNNQVRPFVTGNIEAETLAFNCAACVAENLDKPTDFDSESAGGLCTKYYPQIEIAADNFDMDPMLLRAVVWQESSFNPGAVSYAPISNNNCNPLDIESVLDPDGCVQPIADDWFVDKSNMDDPVSACRKESEIAEADKGEKCKPCAYGLAQVIEYPSNYYSDYSVDYPEAVSVCAVKTGTVLSFNPYNGYDGPCAYSYKYSKALQDAVKLVNNNAGKLGASGDSEEAQNKKSWYSAFFALDSVFGHQTKGCGGKIRTQQQLIDDFNAQKDYEDCGTADADSDLTCGGSSDCCGND